MTQETPAKIMSLLGVALTSMFFLFAVSVSNANFTQTEKTFPAVFNPDQVVAVLDNAANSYNKFVQTNLVEPGVQSYAILQDNVNYVIDEASSSLLAITGFESLVNQNEQGALDPKVAGIFTDAAYFEASSQGFNMDNLYAILLQ